MVIPKKIEDSELNIYLHITFIVIEFCFTSSHVFFVKNQFVFDFLLVCITLIDLYQSYIFSKTMHENEEIASSFY